MFVTGFDCIQLQLHLKSVNERLTGRSVLVLAFNFIFTSIQLFIESGEQEKKDYPVKLMTDAKRKQRIYSNVKKIGQKNWNTGELKLRSRICLPCENLVAKIVDIPFKAVASDVDP